MFAYFSNAVHCMISYVTFLILFVFLKSYFLMVLNLMFYIYFVL